jgi:hypothetical protein
VIEESTDTPLKGEFARTVDLTCVHTGWGGEFLNKMVRAAMARGAAAGAGPAVVGGRFRVLRAALSWA